ncbi:hypothetical protein K0U07_05250, partial [bacterium]|nr:hypothetical protein [bacterium]
MGRRYHHICLIAKEAMEGEYFVEEWQVSLTPHDKSEYHIQWCRYHEGCVFPKLIQEQAHVAFIVDSLEEELQGKKILYGPFTPIDGWTVAFIEECGAPVELIETTLTDEQVVVM